MLTIECCIYNPLAVQEYHGRKHPRNHFPYMTRLTVRFEVTRNASAQSLGRGMGSLVLRGADAIGVIWKIRRYRRLVVKVKVGEFSSRLCKLGLSRSWNRTPSRVGGAFDGPFYSTKRVVDGILAVVNQPFKGWEEPILVNARWTRPGLAAISQCTLFAL